MAATSSTFWIAALLTTVYAGCLQDDKPLDLPGDPGLGDVLPFVNPILFDHDHADLAEHQIANAVDLVGHDYLGEKGPPGGFGEIDIVGDYAYVAMFSAGFGIVDIKDPAHPRLVSATPIMIPQTPTFGAYTADIKVDKTGNWVFVAMELSTSPGLLVYDATNKAQPKFVSAWVVPGKYLGCHMIEYAEINGLEYLFCAPLDAAIYVGLLSPDNPTGHREIVTVARFVPNHPKVAQHTMEDPAWEINAFIGSGHDDMTFQVDELTGKPILTVSMWDLGVRFVDVSVPAAPIEMGSWMGDQGELFRGQFHTAMTFVSEGRRIAVAIPEVASPPALFVLDATDFANPKLLSEWKAAADFKNTTGVDQSGRFSMHNFQIVDGKVYLAMYHGGIWVIDLSTPDLQAAPHPVGSYLPHEPRPDGKPYSVGAWDIVVWKGYMITGDRNGGFYVLHHAGDPAGDASYTSFA